MADLFIGIDYSPRCIALVTSLGNNRKFFAETTVYHGVQEDIFQQYKSRWNLTIHHQARDPNDILHYENVKNFMLDTIRKWMRRSGKEPCIGIEDNLQSYTGSNQLTQMAEMKAVLALACHEQEWECHIINSSTARAIWIRLLPNLQQEWSDRKALPIKRRLRELFQLRQDIEFRGATRPYHDIIDAFVQQQAVTTRPVRPPRVNKYADKRLRDFIRAPDAI